MSKFLLLIALAPVFAHALPTYEEYCQDMMNAVDHEGRVEAEGYAQRHHIKLLSVGPDRPLACDRQGMVQAYYVSEYSDGTHCSMLTESAAIFDSTMIVINKKTGRRITAESKYKAITQGDPEYSCSRRRFQGQPIEPNP